MASQKGNGTTFTLKIPISARNTCGSDAVSANVKTVAAQ
ncbi:hypothetical protein SJ05684_b41660 (plasmid) [Sinorhizobium sojae CCBAU 05684]|uniref:Uncharacterized protein n=1 Tax=Sinorhizobium sojae CCBAU 05684 TaxID=716928 RepID=A0A249PGU6_9HYPH|nr:hypothetical protein SJ05684_b41660 [Sinorhizobium sojae CCBAU 05684]